MDECQELEGRAVRRNFACLVWVGSVFAMGWAEVSAVLQPLLVHYGATNAQIGIVQGVLIATLPGMVLSPWITRKFHRKKFYLFAANSLYLLPIGIVGAVAWTGACGSGEAMVGMIVLLMGAGQVAAGFGGLPSQEFFASCIPMRLRGRLAGVSAGLGGLLGVAGAAGAAWLLAALPKPQGYGAMLVLGWLLCQAADSAVLFAREPPTPVDLSPEPWSKAMWVAFLRDSKFLRLTTVICILSPLVGQLPIFASVFAFRDLGFEPRMAALLGLAASLSRLIFSPAAGWLTDRWGARNTLLFWPSLAACAFLPLAAFPGSFAVFAATGVSAVAWSGFSGAMNALTCGLPRPEHRAGHFTLQGFCMVAANSAAPVLLGAMFDVIPFRQGFALLGTLSLAAAGTGVLLLRDFSPRGEDCH